MVEVYKEENDLLTLKVHKITERRTVIPIRTTESDQITEFEVEKLIPVNLEVETRDGKIWSISVPSEMISSLIPAPPAQ